MLTCMSVPGALGSQKRELDMELDTDGCELLFGYWESNPGLIEKQQVLLIGALSFQPQHQYFKI